MIQFKLNKEVISRETRLRNNFIYLPAVRSKTVKKSFYNNGSVVYYNYLVNKDKFRMVSYIFITF